MSFEENTEFRLYSGSALLCKVSPSSSKELQDRVYPDFFKQHISYDLQLKISEKFENQLRNNLLAPNREDIYHIAKDFIAWGKKQKSSDTILLQAENDCTYWIIGDTHGHLSAVQKIYSHILYNQSSKNKIIFLGDTLDRGKQCFEVMCFVWNLLMKNEAIYILGNHDKAIYRNSDGKFSSYVTPSESADELNAMLSNGDEKLAVVIADALTTMNNICPSMLELSNVNPVCPQQCMILTHGGVPHTDLHDSIRSSGINLKEFTAGLPQEIKERVVQDFSWIRMVRDLPKKHPNRASKGCELGTKDFDDFRLLHWWRSGREISFIIRGHDHESKGYDLYSYDSQYNPNTRLMVQKKCGVLTINSMEPEAHTSGGLYSKRDIAFVCWKKNNPLILNIIETSPKN